MFEKPANMPNTIGIIRIANSLISLRADTCLSKGIAMMMIDTPITIACMWKKDATTSNNNKAE